MTYLHQVSYLRLRDELGVCLSCCCLSGTTCVLVVVQYTAVYLVQRVCILVIVQNITTLLLLLCTWYTVSQLCVCLKQTEKRSEKRGSISYAARTAKIMFFVVLSHNDIIFQIK